MRARSMSLVTKPEPCESCGTRVAVTRRDDDGATRLSNIADDGAVLPGPHTPLDCQSKRGA